MSGTTKDQAPADPFCSVLEHGVHKVSVNVGCRCSHASATCLLIETIRDLGSGLASPQRISSNVSVSRLVAQA